MSRSVLLGADYYEDEVGERSVPLGIGRDSVLDRVIVDKNARIGCGVKLVNEKASTTLTARTTSSATGSSWCRRMA